ncbi:hypothetical protein M0R04_04105 [Candidatus Dojkabacteria bacterium]|jgi:hypothetical protein|nr:hypothetical protein [Candidatus Dojkabacteria bacterium]
MSIKVSNIIVVDNDKNLQNLNSAIFVGSSHVKLPTGNISERPIGTQGKLRYNSEINEFEGYTDQWGSIGGSGLKTSLVSANTVAVSGKLYVLTANVDLTLPLDPDVDDIIGVSNRSGYTNSKIPEFTVLNTEISENLQSVAYGNGKYIFCGLAGVLKTTTDATNWDIINDTTTDLYSLCYGNGIYLYGGLGTLATSTDTHNWEQRSTIPGIIRDIIYADGLYVFGGAAGSLRSSTDSINWQIRTSGTTAIIYSLTYGNGIYLYGNGIGGLGTSTDVINWTSYTSGVSGTSAAIQGLVYGNNKYVYAVGGGVIATSTNVVNWSLIDFGAQTFTTLNFSDNSFVVGGNAGVFGTSTDAINWTFITPNSSLAYTDTLCTQNSSILCSSTGGILLQTRTPIMGINDSLGIDDKEAKFNLIYTGLEQGWIIK